MLLLLVIQTTGCGKRVPPPEPVIIEKYDEAARKRISQWKTLIQEKKEVPTTEKLISVNRFFNHLLFVSDLKHWGKYDYWATPLETLVSNGGDCEDFAIAKYFTLKSLKVPDEKMRLTYVKSLTLNQAHMVLSYYPTPSADPLVLDNLVKEITPASQRDDLLPVYSFNGTGLWLAKNDGYNTRVADSSRIKRWRELLQRLEDDPTPHP
ncbi:MAG: transglutaminase-like cysteine peptidase [Desulfobulbaceae bacterium]|uniref:Transglutaminase-like cysteine peptidase n=1 Tax=Candidatus Desulfatifera sulfidica TaxID=2841691 RepID=A0A8J6NBR2_9BACT|nr:transglutaminase-like cysteine peptidase [Candidatus Desulfatifera sulfidica]